MSERNVTILSDNEKKEIYEMFSTGNYTKADLGRMYCVSPRTIGRVIDSFKPEVDEYPEVVVNHSDSENLDTTGVYYKVVMSDDLIKILATGGNSDLWDTNQVVIGNDHQNFKTFSDAIWDTRGDQDVLEDIFKQLSLKSKILSYKNENIELIDNYIYYKLDGSDERFPLPQSLSNRISVCIENEKKEELEGLGKFANKVINNVSFRVVNQLYDFLLASDIEINKDGNVVCWKRVTEDFKDCYTKKFDNSIGSLVSVPRNQVDENPENTCSHGLHVCSKSYLPQFGGDRVIKVIVAPEDFVAIPNDYYSGLKAKARVCKYLVVEDVTDKFKNGML